MHAIKRGDRMKKIEGKRVDGKKGNWLCEKRKKIISYINPQEFSCQS